MTSLKRVLKSDKNYLISEEDDGNLSIEIKNIKKRGRKFEQKGTRDYQISSKNFKGK